MIETIEREIDGVMFQIHQFPAREGQKIELKTLNILSPLLNILKDFKSLDEEFDLSKLVKSIQDILCKLDDQTFDDYIDRMISHTYVYMSEDGKKTTPQAIKNKSIYDAIFAGKSLLLYKLLYNIMEVNKFAFFELMGGGGNLTDISNFLTNVIKK